MPEGVKPYPRWDGPLNTAPLILTVAGNEIRRAFINFWSRLALVFIAAYTVMYLGQLYTLQQSSGDSVHTMDNFVDFLNNLRWGVLVIAAVVGGPAILEDVRRGALEIYLSRAVNMTDYLIGKIVALFALTVLGLFLPATIYVLASLIFFKQHPEGWAGALPGALVYSLILGAMISGLALGLSSVSKSSRAATLLLIGGFAILDLVVSNLLASITDDPNLQILSPFAAFQQQSEWIFKGVDSGAEFPAFWGVIVIAGLTVVGWVLLAWKHPRVRGA
jgi:ABC-type transport system involved in multi-copper enzyme maturation permease subunit